MFLRLCTAAMASLPLGATDLSTVLQVGAESPDHSTLTYTWDVLDFPAGAGAPVLTRAGTPTGGATDRVEALLPQAQPGTYRFVVSISNGLATVASTPVEVHVTTGAATAPAVLAPVDDSAPRGGGGGCGQGGGIALLGALGLALGRSRRGRLTPSRCGSAP